MTTIIFLQVGLSDASDLVNTSFARSYTHHQVFMCMIIKYMMTDIVSITEECCLRRAIKEWWAIHVGCLPWRDRSH